MKDRGGNEMTDNLAKIRAALVMCDCETCTEALTALAELERAAGEPVLWQYLDTQHVQIDTPPPSDVWRALYAAPPVPDGMVELREPTPEECSEIADKFLEIVATARRDARTGCAMFEAVRAVMGGKP